MFFGKVIPAFFIAQIPEKVLRIYQKPERNEKRMKVKVTRKKNGCSHLRSVPGSTASKLAQSARTQRYVYAQAGKRNYIPRHTRRGA